jgi:hypothetical protein
MIWFPTASPTPKAHWVRAVGFCEDPMAPPPNNCSARFTDRMFIRCPASLPTAIDKAAAQNLTTASEYVRQSVIARLKSEGIDPAELGEVAR